MAHESSHNDVLWHIDSIQPIRSSYKIAGWVSHKTSDITRLLLGGQNISYNIIDRPDVKSVYPLFTSLGFEFTVDKDDIKKPIDVVLKNETINNIGSLEPWIIKKLGFTNAPKSLVIVDNFYNDPDMIRDYVIKSIQFQIIIQEEEV